MGNITSHSDITFYSLQYLQNILPNEDYLYLELGNFLTDISQFRDPYAYFSARSTILRAALLKAQSKYTNPAYKRIVANLPLMGWPIVKIYTSKWLDDLLGTHKNRFGGLANFLYYFGKAMTHIFFANDSTAAHGLVTIKKHEWSISKNVMNLLEPMEINRIYDQSFTQYYPHEHLDFPPYIEGPDHQKSRLYQRVETSGLIGYLEEQIQYISEELSKVEQKWIHSRQLGSTNNQKRDVLVHLGHILHAIEDYYFHSNFVEIFQWNYLHRIHPERKEDNINNQTLFLLDSLEGTNEHLSRHDPQYLPLRRRFARRIRYPVYIRDFRSQKGFSPSPTLSEASTDVVYTGGFGQNDIFHTMDNALKGIEEKMRSNLLTERIIDSLSELVLFRVIFVERERQTMVGKDGEENEIRLLDEHKRQVRNNEYILKVEEFRDRRILTYEAAEALKSAFKIDTEFLNKYKGQDFPGPGAFLITFLGLMQTNVEQSVQRARKLNGEGTILVKATNNGITSEEIGSHSLLAKDDINKKPLVKQANALAKHASSSIAIILARRISNNPNIEQGLDWDVILRHYLRYPQPRERNWMSWEGSVISSLTTNSIPNIDQVTDRPNFRILGLDFGKEKLQARRKGKKTLELETRYRVLEKRTR